MVASNGEAPRSLVSPAAGSIADVSDSKFISRGVEATFGQSR